MAILAGIDEAGLGPVLGPLVVSSVVFSVEDQLIGKDLWACLKKSVCKTKQRQVGRLLIADSKKAHNKTDGTKHLERTILACLRSIDHNCRCVGDLLDLLCPDCTKRLESYQWHRGQGNIQFQCDPTDVNIAGKVFKADLEARGMKLIGLSSKCIDVAHYNALMAAVRNKASVSFSAVAELLCNIWKDSDDPVMQVIIDRQGGRTRYRENLQKIFPSAQLTILKETPDNSSYQIDQDGKMMKVHFVVGADDKFLPAALASMTSKLIRELLMANINRYFQNHCPDLKPTAGYHTDGHRFLEDLKTLLPDLAYNGEHLIRCW